MNEYSICSENISESSLLGKALHSSFSPCYILCYILRILRHSLEHVTTARHIDFVLVTCEHVVSCSAVG